MKLSFVLQEAGFHPDELIAACLITFEDGVIKQSHLQLQARIANIDEDKFQASVQDAKDNCPISKLLNTNITFEAKLL